MTFRKVFVAIPVGAVLAAAAIAPVATSAHAVNKHTVKKHHKRHQSRFRTAAAPGGNVNCNGTAPPTVPYDLTVPSGKTCTMNGTSVGNDVIVNSGATLIDNAGTVGNDITATSPKGMGIGGTATKMASVGNNIYISGTSGAGPGTNGNNYVCDTSVGNNLSVLSSTSKSSQWIVGDFDEQCRFGGDQVGHNLTVNNNLTRVDVSDNMSGVPPYVGGIGMNLTVMGNLVSATAPVVESNFVADSANCQSGVKMDGDGTRNIVEGPNLGCP